MSCLIPVTLEKLFYCNFPFKTNFYFINKVYIFLFYKSIVPKVKEVQLEKNAFLRDQARDKKKKI